MAAEAKHVHPPAQSFVRKVLTELPTGTNQPIHVCGHIEQRKHLRGNAPLTHPEVLSAFGGVLRDVARRMLRSQLTCRAAVDGLGVELGAKAQDQVGPVGRRDGEPHVRGGVSDRVGQLGRVDIEVWWLVVLAGPVEADEGVEVDDAASLEFRDLHKRHPTAPGELGSGQARLSGEGAAQGDGEAAPQFGGVPVERDVRG